ncbi:hypothetical protein [uncultured Tateyamaria sp.]|uniref:hypothetical protein n=1 Tax=uncultured Tateyamaria sp. TaxID=455651 RepID=UPI00260EEF37|nr:hypothetical protein [uncultured Tateyamaria sp.]
MADPKLIIRSGESKEITARRRRFSEIYVESGGQLIVPPRSRNWLLLIVSGNVTIRGSIVYRQCVASETGRTINLPNGEKLLFKHPRTSLGGFGGNGAVNGLSGPVRGGRGAQGTNEYGGGGGGGARSFNNGRVNGEDANGFIAGQQIYPGGDGGRINSGSHGGMICIYCPDGEFNGKQGGIDLRGSNGRAGKDAKMQTRNDCGGGGGGSPGGDGGHLYVVAKQIVSEPRIFLQPGTGGAPGKGAKGANNDHAGSNGYEGDHGSFGFVDFV